MPELWIAAAALIAGCLVAVIFWPELTCWLPGARNDRREGYADGMGGKPAQLGRSEAYHRGWRMGVDDCMRLRGVSKRRAF
jgi:hypothetical protein